MSTLCLLGIDLKTRMGGNLAGPDPHSLSQKVAFFTLMVMRSGGQMAGLARRLQKDFEAAPFYQI